MIYFGDITETRDYMNYFEKNMKKKIQDYLGNHRLDKEREKKRRK